MNNERSIFNKIKKEHFFELVNKCDNYKSVDLDDLYNEYLLHDENHLKNLPINAKAKLLQDRWYKSILSTPDYSVYSDQYYICDIWLCWKTYSRTALLALKNPKSLMTMSVIDFLKTPSVILDLGCGFGYTTAGLKEFFPNSKVIGTNIKQSFQYRVAERIGIERGFTVTDDISSVGKVDVIFASEYFEHIINPIEHLYNVLKNTNPKYLIIANGFSGTAIGHFNYYNHMNNKYSNKQMSVMFNKSLKMLGYEKIKTKVWNNRPALWMKK